MNPITYRITLDLAKNGVQHVLSGFKVGDTNRRLEIRLTNNGIPYVIGEGVSAYIGTVLPNGTKHTGLCQIEGNVIIYDVEEVVLSAEGELTLEFKIGDVTNDKFSSAEIMLLVYPQEIPDDVEPPVGDTFESVNQALAYIRVASDRANQEAQNATDKAKEAEDAAKDATEAAENAENAATDAKIAEGSAISAAQYAENNAIKTASVDDSGNLIVTRNNGNTLNAGRVKGEKGDKGDKGDKGETGAKGAKGDKGDNGIVDYSLVAPALKCTASGNPIRLDDVSPLEHEIKVTAELELLCGGDIAAYDVEEEGLYTVEEILHKENNGENGEFYIRFVGGKYCGIPLDEIPPDFPTFEEFSKKVKVGDVVVAKWYWTFDDDGEPLEALWINFYLYATVEKHGKNLVPIPFYFTNPNIPDLTMTDNVDGSLSIKGSVSANTSTRITTEFSLPAGVYTISGLFPDGWNINTQGYALFNGQQLKGGANTVTLTEEKTVYLALVFIAGVEYDLVMKPIVENGDKEPTVYTSDENGNVKGIIGLGEDMTLIADNGATIAAEYNKDLNKVIEEINQKLSALSAAVVNNG